MCGIVGVLTLNGKDASEIALKILKILSYRGYDSAGIAATSGSSLRVLKVLGDASKLRAPGPAKAAIAHTRWATHGKPDLKNAQPHLSCDSSIAVVENGIVENHVELRKKLKAHKFSSSCDAEPLAHLLEEAFNNGLNWKDALEFLSRNASGLFSAVFLTSFGEIYGIKRGNPLFLGLGDGILILSSDLQAMADYATSFVPLKEGEFVRISPQGYEIVSSQGKVVRQPLPLQIAKNFYELRGYESYMLKEIMEQPEVMQRALLLWYKPELQKIAETIATAGGVALLGCGSSFNAATIGAYFLSKLAGIAAMPVIASEAPPVGFPAVIAISQSGETQHVLLAVKELKASGSKVFGLTNVEGSQLTFLSNSYLNFGAGPELSVLATKTFTNEVLSLLLIALKASVLTGKLTEKEASRVFSKLSKLPALFKKELEYARKSAHKLSREVVKFRNIFYLGHYSTWGLALEGALKLKEITYLHAEPLPSGELLHGHLALVDSNHLSVVLIPPEEDYRAFVEGNMAEIKARNGKVLAVTPTVTENVLRYSDVVLKLSNTQGDPLLDIFLFIPHIQLLAYNSAKLLDRPIDRPRNLAKTITVT